MNPFDDELGRAFEGTLMIIEQDGRWEDLRD